MWERNLPRKIRDDQISLSMNAYEIGGKVKVVQSNAIKDTPKIIIWKKNEQTYLYYNHTGMISGNQQTMDAVE